MLKSVSGYLNIEEKKHVPLPLINSIPLLNPRIYMNFINQLQAREKQEIDRNIHSCDNPKLFQNHRKDFQLSFYNFALP